MEISLNIDDINCFVCKNNNKNLSNIINTTATYSGIPVFDILDRFGCSSNISFDTCLCSLCLAKINDYDFAYESAERIRSELISLLTTKLINESNVLSGLGENCNEGYTGNIDYVKIEPTNQTERKRKYETRKTATKSQDSCKRKRKSNKRKDKKLPEIVDDTITVITSSEHITKKSPKRKNIQTKASSENDIVKVEEKSTIKSEKIYESTDEKIQPASYNCTQKGCNVIFQTSQEFLTHRKETGHKKHLVCDICDQRFDRKPRYVAHMSFHKNGRPPFECDVCGKELAQELGLIRHRRLHTGEQPYQCHHCGKRFKHNTSFTAHKLLHENIRGKKCTVCGLVLGLYASLKIHMMIHTGEKPHECPVCQKRFNKRYNMTSHLRIHQGLPPVPLKTCQICSKTFTRVGKLKEHLVKDHNFVTPNVDAN